MFSVTRGSLPMVWEKLTTAHKCLIVKPSHLQVTVHSSTQACRAGRRWVLGQRVGIVALIRLRNRLGGRLQSTHQLLVGVRVLRARRQHARRKEPRDRKNVTQPQPNAQVVAASTQAQGGDGLGLFARAVVIAAATLSESLFVVNPFEPDVCSGWGIFSA